MVEERSEEKEEAKEERKQRKGGGWLLGRLLSSVTVSFKWLLLSTSVIS